MIHTKLACYLALNRLFRLNPKKMSKIRNLFSDIRDCFTSSPSQLKELGCSEQDILRFQQVNWHQVELELHWQHAAPHHHLLCIEDPDYPPLLKEISSAPLVLFVRGDLSHLNRYCIALVGSRNATPDGLENAFHFSQTLAKAGICLSSGLALGIDGACHQAALQQLGGTIAVMATGIDVIYPTRHQKLAEQIIANGALISEFPLTTRAAPLHFPQRNRIISGLSLGVVVIEASLRSGSLITARMALEQGRELFALPGSIHNPLAKGCHELIRQGAKLIDTVDHIFEEVASLAKIVKPLDIQNKSVQQLEINHQNLVKFIGYDVISVENLIQRCGYSAETVTRELFELELQGFITAVPGGFLRRNR